MNILLMLLADLCVAVLISLVVAVSFSRRPTGTVVFLSAALSFFVCLILSYLINGGLT